MRYDDYKNHLDKITCSDEFRRRMEDLLSAEPDGEYADSVSTLERAEKINYHRWAGLAASAVLIVGIGGVAIQTIKHAPDAPPTHSGESDNPIITTENNNIDETGEYYFSFENNTYYRLAMGVEGYLPDELAEKLIERINSGIKREYDREITVESYIQEAKYNCDLFDHDSVPNTECEDYVFTICSDTDEDFLYKVSDNNVIYIADNGTESLYFADMDLYGDINRIISENIFSYDWTVVYDEYSEEYSSLLNKYRDEIIMTPDIALEGGDIHFYTNLPYTIHGDTKGTIHVYYSNGRVSETFHVTYQAPVEFVMAVDAIMDRSEFDELESEPITDIKENLAQYFNDSQYFDAFYWGMTVNYATGQGQFSKGFPINNVDESTVLEFFNILNSYEWTATDESYVSGESINIGNYLDSQSGSTYVITRNGELYWSGTVYKVENQDLSEIQRIFDKFVYYSDETSLAYTLCTKADNFTTLESDISIYYNPLDETGEHTPVNCTGRMYYENVTYGESKDSNGNFYYTLNDFDSEYSGEIYKNERYWAFIERGNSIAKGFYRGDRDYEGYRVFTRDDYIASGGYDNYDAINIDYDSLYNDVLYPLVRVNEAYMNVQDYELTISEDGYAYCRIEYNVHDESDSNEIIEFEVADNGALIYLNKSLRSLETLEETPYLIFQLQRDYEGYYPIFDDPDFAMPNPTDALWYEFSHIEGT